MRSPQITRASSSTIPDALQTERQQMSTVDLLLLQRLLRQLTEDVKRAEDRITFLQDEQECARIALVAAESETSRKLVSYRCNSIEMPEDETAQANESIRKHQEQLSWIQIQLDLAEQERNRLRAERHQIEVEIKSRNSQLGN
jgi:chromosome segregation ATPase